MKTTRPIRIGHLYSAMRAGGGVQRVIMTLRQGIDAGLVTPYLFLLRRANQKQELDLGGMEVVPSRSADVRLRRVPTRPLRQWLTRAWLTWSIVRRRIDILHIHRGVDASHRFTAAICRLCGIRVVRTVHMDPVLKAQKPFLLRRHLNRVPDAWVVLAPEHADSLERICGVARERIHLIPNGVDIARFRAPAAPRETLRASWGVETKFVLLSLARLDLDQKDYPTLLEALALARAERPELQLLIAGEGSGRKAIEAEIVARGLTDSVRMLGHRNDAPELMAAADALVLSTHGEGFGCAVAEAMAAELPVIATDVNGVRFVCEDGRAGLLVKHQDASDLARAMVRLASDPALRKTLMERGKQRVQLEFSDAANVRRYQQLYQAVLAGRGPELLSGARDGEKESSSEEMQHRA